MPKPHSAVRNDIITAVYKEWTDEWQLQSAARHSRSFYDKPDSNKARFVYRLARLELGRFVRIVTGHNNLNFFQTKLGLWHDPLCRFCGEYDETITHLIFVCPCLAQERRDIFLDRMPGPDRKWSVRSLLNFSYVPPINLALEGTWAHGDPPAGYDLGSCSDSPEQSDDER